MPVHSCVAEPSGMSGVDRRVNQPQPVAVVTSTDGTMTSRRSSDTSLDERQSKASTCISLEYDDYPLDLVSASARETERRILAMIPDWAADAGERSPTTVDLQRPAGELRAEPAASVPQTDHPAVPSSSSSSDEAVSPVRDQLLAEEMITDMGRRSYCDYDTGERVKTAGGRAAVFVPYSSSYAKDPIGSFDESPSSSGGGGGDGTHKPGLRRCLHALCGACMSRYHPLPVLPSRTERCAHALRCPPHGPVAVLLTLALCTALLWATVWAVGGQRALPGGDLFALVAVATAGYLSGRAAGLLRLPPVLGERPHTTLAFDMFKI